MNAGTMIGVRSRRTLGSRTWARVLAAAAACMLMLLAACGGSSTPPPSEGSATLDAAGGEVSGPDGVKLTVPAGALASASTFRIARDGNGAPEIGGARLIAPVYAITPHGTAFAESARVSIPFNPADVAAGTRPMLLKAEPGGRWTALASEVVGNTVSAADTASLSYFSVGTCLVARDANIPGPDPLLYCPASHELKLTLNDGNGSALPVQRNVYGNLMPVQDITAPTTLNYTLQWKRPRGTVRSDLLSLSIQGAGLQPSLQPLAGFSTPSDFTQTFTTTIDPATVPGASGPNGVVIRLRASASYTVDAFYPGCVCLKPASWDFDTEIPVRVIYRGTQPVISQQPQNQSVAEGQPASFSVTASGASLSYQWSTSRTGVTAEIAGATGPTYAVGTTAATDNGRQYLVRVCSAAGTLAQQCINSDAATLSVTATPVAPVFTAQPQSIGLVEGQTASLSAVATGQPAPTVTWARVVTVRGARTLEPVCTATTGRGSSTSATCSLGVLTLVNDGERYIALASNAAAQDVNSSIATLRVTAVAVAPAITSPNEPRDQTVATGSSVSWTVTASGTAPLNFRWRTISPDGTVNANNVCAGGVDPGQSSSATLRLVNVPQACDGYRFQALVGNAVQADVASRAGLLTVTPAPAAPQIVTALAARSALDGATVSFNVVATGNPGTFSYGWTLDGAAVPRVVAGCGTGDSSCSFIAALADNGKSVAVSVSNGVAPAANSNATLNVTTNDVAASITQQPVAQSVVVGATASFTIAVAGTPTPTVTWQTSTDGNNWTGAGSGNTLTLASTTLAQDGLQVRAVVTNTTASASGPQPNTATSNVVTLSVVASLPANALTGVQVAAHADRSLVLRADGSVVAFGMNTDPVTGGFPTSSLPARPVVVAGLPAIRQVAIGTTNSSWALGTDGSVWGWGFVNSVKGFGQGPANTQVSFASPVRVLMAAGTPIDRVCQIAGTLYGVVMVRSDVTGGTCAAGEARSVWFSGDSISSNEVGGFYATRFDRLAGDGLASGLPQGRWILEVFTSKDFSSNTSTVFARANDGTVYAWGWNAQGQLGTGDTTSRTVPTIVAGWQGATRIAATAEATLALMADGSVKGSGSNVGATLGIGSTATTVTTPTTLLAPTGASELSAASGQTGAMALVGGQLQFWGSNNRFSGATQLTPIAISAPVSFAALSVAGLHALAIGPGGAVYAWGNWQARGCGNFDNTSCNDTQVPTLVLTP